MNTQLTIGQKCTYNYDRNFMTTAQQRKRDGITVIVDSEIQESGNNNQLWVWVKFGISNCGLMPVMIQELTPQ
jgi:hypothetical protein